MIPHDASLFFIPWIIVPPAIALMFSWGDIKVTIITSILWFFYQCLEVAKYLGSRSHQIELENIVKFLDHSGFILQNLMLGIIVIPILTLTIKVLFLINNSILNQLTKHRPQEENNNT